MLEASPSNMLRRRSVTVTGMSNMSLGSRIRRARELAGLQPAELARRVGVSPQAVQQWESDQVKNLRHASQQALLAALPGVSPSWLLYGIGSEDAAPSLTTGKCPNTIADQHAGKLIPVLDWQDAPRGDAVMDKPQERAHVWASNPLGERCYALTVISDTMEPKIPRGALVVVDPDARPGDTSYVLVWEAGADRPRLTQLEHDGPRVFARPCNPRYPVTELHPEDQVVGVVRQLIHRFE